jgi:hypothetical protein
MKIICSIVLLFSLSFAGSSLSFVTAVRDSFNGIACLRGATSLAVSADNKNVYVASKSENAVAVFSVTSPTQLASEKGAIIKRKSGLSVFRAAGVDRIDFFHKCAGMVGLSLIDAQGKVVRQIMNIFAGAGAHTVKADFSGLRHGIYFLRYDGNGENRIEKITLITDK